MCTTYNRIVYICNVLRKQIHSVTYFSTQSYVFYLKTYVNKYENYAKGRIY